MRGRHESMTSKRPGWHRVAPGPALSSTPCSMQPDIPCSNHTGMQACRHTGMQAHRHTGMQADNPATSAQDLYILLLRVMSLTYPLVAPRGTEGRRTGLQARRRAGPPPQGCISLLHGTPEKNLRFRRFLAPSRISWPALPPAGSLLSATAWRA